MFLKQHHLFYFILNFMSNMIKPFMHWKMIHVILIPTLNRKRKEEKKMEKLLKCPGMPITENNQIKWNNIWKNDGENLIWESSCHPNLGGWYHVRVIAFRSALKIKLLHLIRITLLRSFVLSLMGKTTVYSEIWYLFAKFYCFFVFYYFRTSSRVNYRQMHWIRELKLCTKWKNAERIAVICKSNSNSGASTSALKLRIIV